MQCNTETTYILFKATVAVSDGLQFGMQVTAWFGKNGRNNLFTDTTGKVASCKKHLSTVILNV